MTEMTDQGTLINHDREAHEKYHLCKLVEARQMKTVADLSKNPQYICRSCGRVAANAGNLCEPVKL